MSVKSMLETNYEMQCVKKYHFLCIIFLLCIIFKKLCRIISKVWTYYLIRLYLGYIKCYNFQRSVSYYSNKCLKCHFQFEMWGEILDDRNVHDKLLHKLNELCWECKTWFKTASFLRAHKAKSAHLGTQQENTNRFRWKSEMH